ncbi:MAG: 1-deoxy-D-xylulose-5-phosphate reductoisomerase [Terriglobia bacterium]
MGMKALSILGSTGSIGRNCLKVIEEFPDEFRVIGLAAGSNGKLLCEQIERFQPKIVSVSTDATAAALRQWLQRLPPSRRPKIRVGLDGAIEVATHPESNFLVSAIVGIAGLVPTYRAIQCGKTVALANKEILVVAGALVKKAARQARIELLPIDSEHNAIHQCLRAGVKNEVRRIILTASGGPFRKFSQKKLKTVTPEMALNHPTWRMGNRVTIDSATMMNKGFEILEAHWLFDLPVDKISVVIHPQSTVHSMVEFFDGSIVAQLGITDMKHPIQYALTYPRRREGAGKYLDLEQLGKLEFHLPNLRQYPCLKLAYQAATEQGALPCALNAADEVAVEYFLSGKIPFLSIPQIVERMLKLAEGESAFTSLEDLLQYDERVRKESQRLIELDYLHRERAMTN